MNKEQISTRIKEIESELTKLREDLNKPDKITRLAVGDVFAYSGGSGLRVLVLSAGYETDRYVFGYCSRNALQIWCDYSDTAGGTAQEVLKKLNDHDAKFIRNISEDVSNLVAA